MSYYTMREENGIVANRRPAGLAERRAYLIAFAQGALTAMTGLWVAHNFLMLIPVVMLLSVVYLVALVAIEWKSFRDRAIYRPRFRPAPRR